MAPLRPTLAISLYVSGKTVILATGDSVAADRERRLVHAGATVRHLEPGVAETADFTGAAVLMAHTGDPGLDRRLAERARKQGLLAYAHDQPDVSDFAMPALLRRGPLSIAISTDAAAPALSRRIREQLEALLENGGEELDALIEMLIARRAKLPRERRSELYETASRLTIDGRLKVSE